MVQICNHVAHLEANRWSSEKGQTLAKLQKIVLGEPSGGLGMSLVF